MNSTKRISSTTTIISGISLFLSLVPLSVRAEENAVEIRAVSASHEQYERDVDSVAMASQEQAISKLTSLLAKYRKTSQEPVLLAKLAELQQQNASILFRIAHGAAHRGKKVIDLSHFNKMMTQGIKTLTVLIEKYPSYQEVSHAYFLRGKGYEEIENKIAAAKDYTFLVNNFPLAEEATPAYMSLAEFAIDANEHAKAISYLKEVEKKPDDNHYPFALYKMAWAYYNLKDIPSALKYAEKQIHYYNEIEKTETEGSGSNLSTSDNALKENTLLDSAVFYFEGYEQNPDQYSSSKAFAYFRNLDKGPTLGKILLRYSKLLRAHSHDHDLVAWKDLILNSELSGDLKSGETLEIVLNTYDHLLNRRDYPAVIKTAQDIVELYKFSKKGKNQPYLAMTKAQKTLLDTAEGMQQVIEKNKEADGAKALSSHLASIYQAFTQIVDESDPRIPRVHYNLAETLFTIKDYEGATINYRWVVDHGTWKKNDKQIVTVADASKKAIAARYEVLGKNAQLPKDIKPVSISSNSQTALDPQLAEWIGWVDTHWQHSQVGMEAFFFETNRALYHHGHILEALKRMNDFATDQVKSEFAIPSATLVLDTLIATSDWVELLKKTEEYLDISEWKTTAFNKRLFAVSADANYKLIEIQAHAKNYPETLKLADSFLKRYNKSERFADTLVLAGAAAMDSQQPDMAMKYFTRLIEEAPKSGSLKDALLARASIEESHYALGDATRDYNTYLKLPGKPDDSKDADKRIALQKKIMAFTWISADWVALKALSESKDVCTGALASDCAKYQALGALFKPELFKVDLETAFDRARKESGELAALWAAVSLEGARDLAFRDRLLAIRHLSKNWDELDPLVKFSILPSISESIPNALRMNRKMMNEVAPLRADEKYITHRVDIMREMENAVTLAMKLPWARIKAEALNELASNYIDFSTTLAALTPKGLDEKEIAVYQETIRKITVPFEEKGQDLRSKAFQIASHYAIESTAFANVSQPFFADNPSQAKALRKPATLTQSKTGAPKILANPSTVVSAVDLDLGFLETLDPTDNWTTKAERSSKQSDKIGEVIDRQFVSALQTKNWAKVVYFVQEAKIRSAFKPAVLSAMKAVSLNAVGAKAEALLELEDSRSQWDSKPKLFVLGVLSRHYEQSYAIDRAQTFSKEIEVELTPKTEVVAAKAAK